MVFSSLEFLFMFFAAAMLIYFAIPAKNIKWRNAVLFIVSLFFYSWGEPIYVCLMIFSTVLDYTCGKFADKYRGTAKAKISLLVSICGNLGLLILFKYTDFLIGTANGLFNSSIPLLNIALPIGISFYTFQTMSYTIDVYRGDAKVQNNIISFGAYVTLFPQLIAGPIVRYQDIDDQLRSRPHNLVMLSSGTRTFICGLAKKILLANSAATVVKTLETTDTALGAWLGIIFYSFQIYFDFSGYSDMAIGLGKMMGFTFRENFYYPYISTSITEFWRRWHISLSTWFREYVYIPLGGNRCGKARNFLNLFAVWLLTGIWHGASWNYVLWGLYYWVILMIEKAFLLKALKKVPKVFSHIYSLFFIAMGWWLFFFEDLSAGIRHLGLMFGRAASFTSGDVNYTLVSNLVLLAVLVIAATPLPKKIYYQLYEKSSVARWVFAVLSVITVIVCTAYLVNSSYNPFIYFQF